MSIFNEKTKTSQRKIWSMSVLVIFILYALVILFKRWPNDIPTHIAYIIGIVATYYFAKSTVMEVKDVFKGKAESKKNDESMGSDNDKGEQ